VKPHCGKNPADSNDPQAFFSIAMFPVTIAQKTFQQDGRIRRYPRLFSF
jgi:hypothetical protein